MATEFIDGQLFKTLLTNGCLNLIKDIDHINALNVFPVPDGDTGTNMRLTIEGGVNILKNDNELSLSMISKKVAKAMTLSARGNSGVILSQFFKGVSIGLDGIEKANIMDWSNSFMCGVKQAYKVVQKPTEGTMLTVMREASEVCNQNIQNFQSIEDYFKCFIKEAHASLNRTPLLLNVLKEAGVVDSGGAGFNRIIEGMIQALDGNILVSQITDETTSSVSNSGFNANSTLEYGYCTEFILQLLNSKVNIQTFDINVIVDFLKTIGDSIVAFKDEDIVKIHVHTFTPGKVIEFCQQFGEYVTFKMENMSIQHSQTQTIQRPLKYQKYAVVAVSSGEGISNCFKQMGCDIIVSGGQTMNPSSADFIHAFEQLNTDFIYCFPNNKNIIMAAKQAAEEYKKAKVYIIETTSIAQCYSALSMLDFSCDNENIIFEEFQQSILNVDDGSVTYAIRDCEIEGIIIHKNDFMCFYNHHLVSANQDKVLAINQMFQQIKNIEDKQVITIICGKEVKDSETMKIIKNIQTLAPHLEIGQVNGEQDIYPYLFVIE